MAGTLGLLHPAPILPAGRNIDTGTIRGYYIDFSIKADAPHWPPSWFPWPGYHRFMAIAQWGLGAHERYLNGDGEVWLDAAAKAAEHLVGEQAVEGVGAGGWFEQRGHVHTFQTRSPWLSAMAQGECASLLIRVGIELGDERLVDCARKGLQPMLVPTSKGGVQARLEDGVFLEEYPTSPPSFVLNGAIFALWGAYDVWRAADDEPAGGIFLEAAETLLRNLTRWDTGFWSRYDLYSRHPIVNVASPFYHALHTNQLRALAVISPAAAPIAEATADRFDAYAASPWQRGRALAQKAAFRVLVRKPLRRR